jgi:tetratricopeptide (TPR) repeat protein
LGNAFYCQENFSSAIKQYRIILDIDPGFLSALNMMGKALAASGHTEEAVLNFRKALVVDPEYVQARLCLAVFFNDNGKPIEALQEYQQVAWLCSREETVFEVLEKSLWYDTAHFDFPHL